jgi:peptidoglycan/xylan/chitin deacetylase (PgdA/CDA1 family)
MLAAALWLAAGCSAAPPRGDAPAGAGAYPPPAPQSTGGTAAAAGAPAAFESDDFVVAFPRAGDTAESLAARYLGDPGKAWMIEDYAGETPPALEPGRPVVIPRQPWNLAGVDAGGYQVVPVLVYHNIGPKARGRLVIAAKAFEEQMRYLKTRGYRVVTLRELYEFISFKRQLPRRAVVITFDDGYRSFQDYAFPILKELGFTATLFVYTDYIGGGRNALGWDDLRRLAREGIDIQGHSKSHGDLRRRPGESEADYTRRMRVELGEPQTLFERHLGRRADIIAYPYGAHDDDLVQKVREYGYVAAFTVRREGNPAFVYPLRAYRSQIYSDMSLEEFARNLRVTSGEPIR